MKHKQIYGLLKPEFQDKSLELHRYLLSPSDMHRMCSFLYFLSFSSACSCFIQVMMVKCLCSVWLKRFSGTSTALLSPSKQNTWSLSLPSSVGRYWVQEVVRLGEGSRSTLRPLAPDKTKQNYTVLLIQSNLVTCIKNSHSHNNCTV